MTERREGTPSPRPEWVEHRPDWNSKCQAKRREIRAEATCSCGITERHTHCPGCGLVLAKGDWANDGITIATLRLPL